MLIATANARTRKGDNLKSALMRPRAASPVPGMLQLPGLPQNSMKNYASIPARRVSIQVARHPEPVGVVQYVRIIAKGCGGAHGDRLIPERPPPQNSKRAIAAGPGRSVVGRAAVGW